MSIRKIAAFLVVALVIIGGPIYVLATGDSNKPEPVEQVSQTEALPEPVPEPAFDKTQFSLDDPSSIWVVVNKQRPLTPQNYSPVDLVQVSGRQQLRSVAAESFSNMINAAKVQGLTIEPLSAYRSYSTQVSVYNNEVRTYGQAVADTQSARPGTSEHQTGLAIDVGGGGCGIEDCFGDTAEGKWIASESYKYGFIVRYVSGKEDTTGYRPEPWHVRYVGIELATEMHEKGVQTLEEFFGLPAAPSY